MVFSLHSFLMCARCKLKWKFWAQYWHSFFLSSSWLWICSVFAFESMTLIKVSIITCLKQTTQVNVLHRNEHPLSINRCSWLCFVLRNIFDIDCAVRGNVFHQIPKTNLAFKGLGLFAQHYTIWNNHCNHQITTVSSHQGGASLPHIFYSFYGDHVVAYSTSI